MRAASTTTRRRRRTALPLARREFGALAQQIDGGLDDVLADLIRGTARLPDQSR
jgi:hypothetical protein